MSLRERTSVSLHYRHFRGMRKCFCSPRYRRVKTEILNNKKTAKATHPFFKIATSFLPLCIVTFSSVIYELTSYLFQSFLAIQ